MTYLSHEKLTALGLASKPGDHRGKRRYDKTKLLTELVRRMDRILMLTVDLNKKIHK